MPNANANVLYQTHSVSVTGIHDFMSALSQAAAMRRKYRTSFIVWRRDHNNDYAIFSWSEWLYTMPTIISMGGDPTTVTLLPYQKYGR